MLEKFNTKEELKNIFWDGSRIHGVSLQALSLLAEKYEYILVGIETYKSNDAFFIRKDLCPTNILSFNEIYKKYLETNDSEESNKEAQKVINNLNLVNVFKADYLY